MSRWVLFDLDGTLTDSQAGILSCYRQTLGSLGLDYDETLIHNWIGPPLAEALAACGVPADRVGEAVETYRSYYAGGGLYENQIYEGVEEMLNALALGGITLGVATSKLEESAIAILEHFDLAGRFEVIAGASRDGLRSRKADVLEHAIEALGLLALSGAGARLGRAETPRRDPREDPQLSPGAHAGGVAQMSA